MLVIQIGSCKLLLKTAKPKYRRLCQGKTFTQTMIKVINNFIFQLCMSSNFGTNQSESEQ